MNHNKHYSSIFLVAAVGILCSLAVMADEKKASTLRSFGAKGDGVADDTRAVQKALDSSSNIDGEKLTYKVNGTLKIAEGVKVLANVTFVQGAPKDPDVRTLYRHGGSDLTLKNVKVNRGNNPSHGSVGDAAGVWLDNIQGLKLENVEVTGDGKGTGIRLIAVRQVKCTGLYVHDMKWETEKEPRYEQLIGLWISGDSKTRSSDVLIERSKVTNIVGTCNAYSRANRQTDGIDVGGTDRIVLNDCYTALCAEGIDLTGSDGVLDFAITNCVAEDNSVFGIKMANSSVGGKVVDCRSVRSGFAGFVVGGPSEKGLPNKISNIEFIRCKAVDSGVNPEHSNTAGFSIMESSYDRDYPCDITFRQCESTDTQKKPTTKVGFYSQIKKTPSGHPNQVVSCKSTGHTKNAIEGAFVVDKEQK